MKKNAAISGKALEFELESISGACPVLYEGKVNGIPVSLYYRGGIFEVSLYEVSSECFQRDPAESFYDRIGDSLDGFLTCDEMIENATDLLSNSKLLNMIQIGNGDPVLSIESYALARGMLDAGVPVDGRDRRLRTPLIRAAQWCKEDVADLLLLYGADPNAVDVDGMTPLMHAAAFCESSSIISMLLKAGAEVNLSDKLGKTALLHSLGNLGSMKKESAAILLEAGADPNIRDIDGETAIFYAARFKNMELTELLLSAGSDPLVADGERHTVLMKILGWSSLDESFFVSFLEKYVAANGDLDAGDCEGKTALFYAIPNLLAGGRMFSLLLSAGADPDAGGKGPELLKAMENERDRIREVENRMRNGLTLFDIREES